MNYTFTTNGLKIGDEELSLEHIISEVSRIKVQENKLVLYTIAWRDFRGADDIEESVVIPKSEVGLLTGYVVGSQISFGEIHGKHSDVYGVIEDCDIHVEDSVEEVTKFLRSYPNGYYATHSFIERVIEQEPDSDAEIFKEYTKKILKLLGWEQNLND